MSDKNFLRLCLFGVAFGFLGNIVAIFITDSDWLLGSSTALLFVSLFAYLIEDRRIYNRRHRDES